MKTKRNKIDAFLATLDSSNEMDDKQYGRLCGAGMTDLAFSVEEFLRVQKNEPNNIETNNY